LKNDYFQKTGENSGIQLDLNAQFSCIGARTRPKKAPYRRISMYTKGLARYRLERERRRKVRLLAEKGLTQEQIAKEIGVSVRTVKRDWKKLHSYILGEFNKQVEKIMIERERGLDRRYEGLPFEQELKLLKQDTKHLLETKWTVRKPGNSLEPA